MLTALFFAPWEDESRRPKKYVGSRCIIFPHHGAAAEMAYAHRNNNGNVFDEMVFSLEGTDPLSENEKQVKDFSSFTCFLT